MPKSITPVGDTKIGKYFLIPLEWCLYGKNNTHGEEKLRPVSAVILVLLAIGAVWGISYIQETISPQEKHLITIYWNTDPVPDPNYVFEGAPSWPPRE